MDIRIEQTAQQRGGEWWHWSVWLTGPDQALDEIAYVEYILHATFPDPIRRVTDRASKFRLNASGWGEFMIHVHIYRHDGTTQKLEHWLHLENAPTRGVERAISKEALPATAAQSVTDTMSVTIFLSYSLADAVLAETLVDALNKQGVRVLTSEDFDPNLPLSEALPRLSRRVNAGVVLVTDVNSPCIMGEFRALQSNNVPVLVARVGLNSRLPPELTQTEMVQVKDRNNPAAIAEHIYEWLGVSKGAPLAPQR